MVSETWTITWFYLFICTNFILGLMVLNWLITFVLLYIKKVPQIQVRYPKPVILCSICFVNHLLITSPLGLIISGIFMVGQERRYFALDMTYSMLWNLSLGAMSWSFIYRVWMIYYDIQWNLALEDSEWSLHIDTQHSNWFLKKKRSWGNPKVSSFILFSIWCAFSIAAIVLTAVNGLEKDKNIRNGLQVLQGFGVPLIFFSIISCKLPQFNDVYSIRKEIKYVLVIYILYIITTVLTLSQAHLGTVGYGLAHLNYCLWLTLISYMLLRWGLKGFNLPTNVWSAIHYNISQYDIKELNEYLSRDHDTEDTDEKGTELSYKNILKDEAGFRAYTKHLSKSYCVENMLFILELYQFKRKVKSLFAKELENMERKGVGVATDHMEITEKAPKSTLVAQMDNDGVDVKERVCICMSLLFMKYIRNGAYFCLNLSYETRDELFANFGYSQNQNTDLIEYIKKNKTEQELYILFDNAINEICSLLHSRIAAFKKSDEFKMFKQVK